MGRGRAAGREALGIRIAPRGQVPDFASYEVRKNVLTLRDEDGRSLGRASYTATPWGVTVRVEDTGDLCRGSDDGCDKERCRWHALLEAGLVPELDEALAQAATRWSATIDRSGVAVVKRARKDRALIMRLTPSASALLIFPEVGTQLYLCVHGHVGARCRNMLFCEGDALSGYLRSCSGPVQLTPTLARQLVERAARGQQRGHVVVQRKWSWGFELECAEDGSPGTLYVGVVPTSEHVAANLPFKWFFDFGDRTCVLCPDTAGTPCSQMEIHAFADELRRLSA